MGSFLLANYCAWIHERCAWIQSEIVRHLLKFAAFGTIFGWFRIWVGRRLFETPKFESDIYPEIFLYFLWVFLNFLFFVFWVNILDIIKFEWHLFFFSAHIIPGCLLLAIPYIEDTNLVIAILTMSLGFNGAATLTNLQNSQDLAPNFAGTLYAIINFIGMSSGFFGPLVKSELAHYGHIVSICWA